MPQINPDECAIDESKTYRDEGEGGDEGHDLNEIKGDLVDEDDVDRIQQPYSNKVDSHRNGSEAHRRKEDIDGGHANDLGSTGRNFPYNQQDFGSVVPGLNPLFPNGFIPPSSQVPYSPYIGSYMGLPFCGSSSTVGLDEKQASSRPSPSDIPPMYSLPGQLGQIPHPLGPWSPGSLYHPLCTASAMAGMLRYPYPFASFPSSAALGSVSPFPLVSPHPHGGPIHPNMLHPGSLPFSAHMNGQNGSSKSLSDRKPSGHEHTSMKRPKSEKPNRPYVKKPLNAFMLYMKEQRAQVVAECTLKESAAINQILGRKWHSLKREEQQKYYEMARKERQLHMQLFPGWSARDNYGKRKKRKKEKLQDCTAQNPKKCRAVFGLEQQQLWCAPCRRKKKCIRYQHDDDDDDDSDDSDLSPEQCQGGQDIGGLQFGGSQNFNNSTMERTSSNVTSNSNLDSRSGDRLERLSPTHSAFQDRIKTEKSSPLSLDMNSTGSSSATNLYDSPTFSSASNEPNNNCAPLNGGPGKTMPRSNSSTDSLNSNLQGAKNRPINDDHYPSLPCNSLKNSKKPTPDTRDRRPDSESNSISNSRQQNIFSPSMLSPGMTMTSPHHNPHHGFMPNFSYFAAASLPNSPLGSLMGFSNYKGLPSPLNMAMKSPGPSVAPGGHPTAAASRHASSALEGRS